MTRFIPWNSRSLDEWNQIHAQGKFVSLGRLSTHYIEKGEGEPIILLHGFNMDLNTWINNVDRLAEQYKVFALDLWGFGFSTRETLNYGYDLYVKQINLFMESMGVQRASLIGHSMGGGIAIKFSLHHQSKVNKLVLVDATGVPRKLQLRAKIFNLPGVGEFLLGLNTNFVRRKNLEDYWIYHNDLLMEDFFEQVTQFQKIEGTSEVLLEILRKEFFHTLGTEIQQLGQMNIPTLIIWGKHDQGILLSSGMKMHQLMEGSRLEIIEDAGHMPNFECPDLFNQLVLDFLEGNQEERK